MATTPKGEYDETPSSPISNTPTKANHSQQKPSISDFTSPSVYINHDAYEPNTPHAHEQQYEAPLSAGTSLTGYDENYGFAYSDFVDGQHGTAKTEDERTPVVSDSQPRIPPSSFPARQNDPLMSPFRPADQQPVTYMPMPQQYVDPSVAFYPSPHSASGYVYADGTPVQQQYGYPQYAQPMPMYQPPQQPMYYPQAVLHHPQPQPPAGQVYFSGPARSRGASPASTVASTMSLTRNGSLSSDLRTTRPKVKLTPDDKKTIVEMAAANSSLRQEDIARMYGKILLSKHRWITQQEPSVPPVPKPPKTVGGRFPAIEQALDEWIDAEIHAGRDVRDQQARDKAKDLAVHIGFIENRFKGSAKWFDKYKARRKAAGKPMTAAMHLGYGYLPYTNAPYPGASPAVLSRSQSTITLSSSSSSESSGQPSQELYHPSPAMPEYMIQHPGVAFAKSEPDLLHLDITPGRQRSQSSPHTLTEPGHQSPSSGKSRGILPTPLALQRQNSYHGTSPSPRRPMTLTRANSGHSGPGIRRSRPTSLAASAFGITPIIGTDDMYTHSPLHSPAPSSVSAHSRQRSDGSLAPFTATMSGMTISPDLSDSGEQVIHYSVPPLTPITPGHGVSMGGVFPPSEYGDLQSDQISQLHHASQSQGRYATMPNKHYMGNHYVRNGQHYVNADFGPGYPAQDGQSVQGGWQ